MKINLKNINLKQAIDLAIIIELEARDRYLEFYNQLGTTFEGDAGSFFLQMSKNEQKHADELQMQKYEMFGNKNIEFTIEDVYDFQEVEAPEYDKARSFMSPMKALLVAKESEIKAYNFFENALKYVADDRAKGLFTELMNEETQHRVLIEEMISKLEDKGEDPVVDNDEIDEPNGL